MPISNSDTISEFIRAQAKIEPKNLTAVVAEKFGISKQRTGVYIKKEVEKGTLIKIGSTRATKFFSVEGTHIAFDLELKGLEEDKVWSKYIKPFVLKYPEHVRRICAFGFTEILNNAIDHSAGKVVFIEFTETDGKICITITDNGVGIYQKIQSALTLDSPREAILHLSKGKFTTDPSKHTGQGIFFTSRMFDEFSIWSDEMLYAFKDEDWFLSPEKCESFGKGTEITMRVAVDTKTDPTEVVSRYSEGDNIGFDKTIVAVALSADPNDPHVSRSQAKRLMMGLEKFKTVVLDFRGVESVGQAFVDEIFRVFKNEYPTIDILSINESPEVGEMIKRGLADALQERA